jgi:hypothetical protein
MIRSMFRGAGRIALWAATMAFLAGVSLLLAGSWLLTYPVLRKSPRERRLKASMDFVSSGIALLTAFSDESVRKIMEKESEVSEDENDGDS